MILAVCCMSLLIVGMDNTIVNVALPSIGHDLHASISGLQWTVDAYVMVLASLLMLSGSMGDRLGRRRTFQTGLVIFSVGSAACGLAPGLGWLVAFRMLQAVGGSMLNPVAMSIIRNVFTDPRERAQAIGIWGAVVGISLGLGPVVGGALVQSVGWRSIFWVNVPIGIAAIVLAARFVPESRADHARRVDPVGQFLVIVVLASVTFAIIEGPGRGWSSPEIVALFVTAAVALVALLLYEPRREEPLIELRFFRSVPFTGATLTALLAFAGFSGFLFLNTLYLQQVQGRSALAAGLLTLPIAGMTIVMAPLSGWMVGRRGTRLPLVVAGAALTVSSLVLTGLATTTSVTLLIVAYLVFGLGFGLVNPPITNTAVSGMPPSQAGVAAGVASTSRQVGQSLGVAVVGAAATSNLHGPIATGLAQASHAGWWIVAACSAGVIILGIASTSKRALATAEPLAALLEPEHHGGGAAATGVA
ncbi:MAG: MFS transporter [Actinomycetota bacterium]|nr:MFS transporter [Actinomycetota bacterium]